MELILVGDSIASLIRGGAILIGGGLFIGWHLFIGKIAYKKIYKRPEKMGIDGFLLFLLSPLAVIIAMFLASNTFAKERENIYRLLIHTPNNANVDMLINHLEKHGCPDSPNAWHRLRGVWYACNQSSYITTNKKQELQTFLMLKGLYLNNEERKIIDNYTK